VGGIPPPFIKIYERGRDTPHPGLLPLLPVQKDFLDEILVHYSRCESYSAAIEWSQLRTAAGFSR
jgi:hypothetical protein